jgi:rhamnosyl/mannosyltransferase
LTGKVRFLGRIAQADLPVYYHAAEVFCLPSVERSEQFGLVQLEAMACRKPVVCCELHNGVTYVNQDGVTGIVVPPREPASLARAIDTLLDDEELRRRLGEAGYRRATGEFSLAKMIAGTLAVYDRALGAKCVPP